MPVSRVPDELKKHSLSDGVGGQYSTNLDRNRYGADDQYLSTVIRYDLEYLRLCPCLVDVEIIDAKNGSGTILVSAGPEYCLCNRDAAQVAQSLIGFCQLSSLDETLVQICHAICAGVLPAPLCS